MSHGIGSLVVVDAGETAFLDLVTGVGYTLNLFTNEVTSGLTQDQIDALDETDFTDATFAGYAPVALTGGSWTVTGGSPSSALYTAQTFTVTVTGTAEDVWGYYMTRTSDGALMWFEQFAGPVVMEFAADELSITPRMTLDDTEGNTVQPGTITAFGGSSAPTGWLVCDGSAVSRTNYSDLFAVLGETYGVGDGATTFNLPDLQQRFPLGKAASGTGATLGETGGAIDHTHGLDTPTAVAQIESQASDTLSPFHRRKTGVTAWDPNIEQFGSTGGTATSSSKTNHTNGTGLQGDTDTENPPYVVVNFIVKV